MAQELKSVSVGAPGFFGLNLQNNGIALDPSWASTATNCVISKDGGMESRKGWLPVNSPKISAGPPVEQIFEYIKGDGTTEIHSCAGVKIWKGTLTLTEITPTIPPSNNNWKAQNFNNNIYYFQDGEHPLEYNGSGLLTRISAGAGFLDSSDAVIATLKPNECLSAFGRLWVADTATNKMKIWWSDALLARQWTGGSSGSLDLRSVLTKGMDTIIGLRAWNGNLIIFLTNNILIYSGAGVPSSMVLVENIVGIGCIARDSIQEIGTDIIFLSKNGVVSLGRSIQEKSLPMTDFSKNIRDKLNTYLNVMDASKVRSVYSEPNAFYLLTISNTNRTISSTFCFDLRRPLDDDSYRVTVWDNITPKSMLNTKNNKLYLGQGGYIGEYTGYFDNTSTYRMAYYTTWLDFSRTVQEFNNRFPNYGVFIKMPKKLVMTITANIATTLTFKWLFDFSQNTSSAQIQTMANVTLYEFNMPVSEYNIAEYNSGGSTTAVQIPLSGTGKVMKYGMECDVNGSKISILRIDITAKLGRIS